MSVLLFIYSYKRLTTYDSQYAANDSIVVLVLPKNNVDNRCLRFSKTKIASNDCFGWMDGWMDGFILHSVIHSIHSFPHSFPSLFCFFQEGDVRRMVPQFDILTLIFPGG